MGRHPIDRANLATANKVLKAQAILWLMCGSCDREAKALTLPPSFNADWVMCQSPI
jgi:hypothetical protein